MNYSYLLLLLIFFNSSYSADPLESLIRNGWLIIKDYGEKVISNIAIPRTSDISQDGSLSFQLDPAQGKALSTLSEMISACPTSIPVQELKELWHVTHISKRLKMTTFHDIHETIEKLSSGKSLTERKSLFTLFQADTIMKCIQITVPDDNPSTPFEFSYISMDGNKKSIIGELSRSTQSQLTLNFASIITIPFSVVYSTTTSFSNKILILSQTDTIPASCDNYLVLQSNPSQNNFDSNINQILTSFGANTGSNPILFQNHCNSGTVKPNQPVTSIIKPASQFLKNRSFI